MVAKLGVPDQRGFVTIIIGNIVMIVINRHCHNDDDDDKDKDEDVVMVTNIILMMTIR